MVVGSPQFHTAAHDYALGRDWNVARLSGAGTVHAPVQPAGGSGTGCAPDDFAGFIAGHIALLRRGACAFDAQVANAQGAGASGIILYDGTHGAGPGSAPGGAYPARLTQPAAIPVIGVISAGMAQELLQRSAGGMGQTVDLDVRTQAITGEDYNVIAESPYGDPDHTVIVDAHLDSIYGAGMLDNASGSTTALEIALQMAKTPTRNRLRYIWFGGEEIGLLGSAYYTIAFERGRARSDRLRHRCGCYGYAEL